MMRHHEQPPQDIETGWTWNWPSLPRIRRRGLSRRTLRIVAMYSMARPAKRW